jgi:hypothetical protein
MVDDFDSNPLVIWASFVDQGTWYVWVEGVEGDDYLGHLNIKDVKTDTLVHREPVGVSYGARFGPDVDDTNYWQERAIEAIDNPDGRHIIE